MNSKKPLDTAVWSAHTDFMITMQPAVSTQPPPSRRVVHFCLAAMYALPVATVLQAVVR